MKLVEEHEKVKVHETSIIPWNKYKYMKQVQVHAISTSLKQVHALVMNTSTWSNYKGMRQACVQLYETFNFLVP